MMKKMFFAAIAAMCACSAQARKWGGPMVTGPDPAGRDKIDAIIRDWKPADAAKPRRVLVCDICAGYRHGDAIGYPATPSCAPTAAPARSTTRRTWTS